MPRQWRMRKNREESKRCDSDVSCITSNIFAKALEKFVKFRFLFIIFCIFTIFILSSHFIFAKHNCNFHVPT